MSDVAAAPTQEAPVEVVETVVETPVEIVPDTRTAPEKMESIRERGRGVREPTVAEAVNIRADLNEAGQKVDPDSRKYVEGDTPLAEQPVEEPVASEVPVTGADELTVEPTPAEDVEIPIPEGNPLRARGFEKLPFPVPAEHEEIARSLVNQAMSKKEVEILRGKTADAERVALESRAEAEFWRDNVGEVFGAEFQQVYRDHKETYGEESAEVYKRGEMAKAQEKLAEMRDQATAKASSQRMQEHGQAFSQLAIRDAMHGLSGEPRYPGWTMDGPHGMNQAFAFYGDELDALTQETRRDQLPDADRWHEVAAMFYRSHPAGLQANVARDAELRETLRKEVEGEATQREKANLEAARTAIADNPLAALPSVETGHTTTPGEKPRTTPEILAELHARGRGIIP